METPEQLRVAGGDICACLDDKDIDTLLAERKDGSFPRAVLPARWFYEFRTGQRTASRLRSDVSSRLREMGPELGRIYMPVHIRHHWLLVVVKVTGGNWILEVYDSAASVVTRVTLAPLLLELFPRAQITFCPSPRQRRGSNECGLFVVCNVLAHLAGKDDWFGRETADLSSLRRGVTASQFLFGQTYRHNPYGGTVTRVFTQTDVKKEGPQRVPHTTSEIDNGGRTIGQCRCEVRCRGVCAVDIAKSRPRGGLGAEEACDVLSTAVPSIAQDSKRVVREGAPKTKELHTVNDGPCHRNGGGPKQQEQVEKSVVDVDEIVDTVQGRMEEVYAAEARVKEARAQQAPGEMIDTCVLDFLMERTIAEVQERSRIRLGATTNRGRAKPPKGNQTDRTIYVQPLCHNEHFVLLVCLFPKKSAHPDEVRIYDSLRNYHTAERDQIARRIAGAEEVREVYSGPQARNDCAFHCLRALRLVLFEVFLHQAKIPWDRHQAMQLALTHYERELEAKQRALQRELEDSTPTQQTGKPVSVGSGSRQLNPMAPAFYPGNLERTGEGGKSMSDEAAIEVLRYLHPGAQVVVSWAFVGQPSVYRWVGTVYEPRGRKEKRVWPVQYEIVDTEQERSTVQSQLPRPFDYKGWPVTIVGITPCKEKTPAPEEMSRAVRPPNLQSMGVSREEPKGPGDQKPPTYAATMTKMQPAEVLMTAGRDERRDSSPGPTRPATAPRPAITLSVTPPMMSPSPPPSPKIENKKAQPQQAAATAETAIALRREAHGVGITPLIDNGDTLPGVDGSREEDEELVMMAYPVSHLDGEKAGLNAGVQQCASLRFRDLRRALGAATPTIHPVARKALTDATRNEHARVLGMLARAPNNYDAWPLGRALLEVLSRERISRRWKWTTAQKKAATTQGTLRMLPLYREAAAIDLTKDAEWASGLKYFGMRAKEEVPRAVRPMNHTHARDAVRLAETAKVKVAIALSWLVAGRVGDILELRAEDVSYDPNTKMVSLTYRRGKTVSRRGPYSVHSEVTEEWAQLFATFFGKSAPRPFAGVKVADVTKALRRVDPALEARSIRRGAIQTMAVSGVPDEVLIMFSGHATIGMLHRYLQWGSVGSVKKNLMAAAARELTKPAKAIKGGGAVHVAEENRKPRFLQFLGKEMPPSSDLAKWLGERVDTRGWPLHVKPVSGAVNLYKLQDLPMGTETRARLEEGTRWLRSTGPYEELLQTRKYIRGSEQSIIRLNRKDMDGCIASGKFELAEPTTCENAVGARIFTRAEQNKRRRRPLLEPHINDKFQSRPGVRLPLATDIEQCVRRFRGGSACILDFASWYDQLPLSEQVRAYFGAPHRGKVVVPKTLPMGFRMSCRIAQNVTLALVDKCGDGLDVAIQCYIDNILIIGKNDEDVQEAERRVRQRAALVGAIFNAEVIHSRGKFEFLGVEYDLEHATAGVTAKSRSQLQRIRSRLEQVIGASCGPMIDLRAAKRAVAAVYGTAIFCSRVAGRTLARDFWPLRYLREMEGATHWDEWSAKAPMMRRDTATQLLRWLREIGETAPRNLIIDERPVDAVVFVDASANAWGAVCVEEGRVTTMAGPWQHPERMWSSVAAEPRAMWEAVRNCKHNRWRKIVIVTDHDPLVWAAQRGYGKAYEYNRTLLKLQSTRLEIDVVFVPGSANPADEPSRGKSVNMQKVATALQMIRAETGEKRGRGGDLCGRSDPR